MERYIAERYRSAKPQLSLNADALNRCDDIIDLSIGDTDIITDSRIIDAACADAKRGYTRYGIPKGDPELIDAICRAWKEDFGQDLNEDEVLATTSSSLGMTQVMMGLLNPGDEVLVFGPYFSEYAHQIAMAGGVPVEVMTSEADDYCPTEDAILSKITPRTRAMIINVPTNPTGAVYPVSTQMLIAGIAQEHDLIVVADEIYTRYIYDGKFIPMRTIPGMKDRTVTLNSFSKNFMMTGWRVGYIVAHPAFIRVFNFINGSLTYAVPSISQRAAINALEIRGDVLENYISRYRDRVMYASDRIEKMPALTLARPRGTFYLFPGIARTGMTDDAFCDALLQDAHILVSRGSVFGKSGAGHFRIACTVPMEKLEEAMDRIESCTAKMLKK